MLYRRSNRNNLRWWWKDRKSTRLNSSHLGISFFLTRRSSDLAIATVVNGFLVSITVTDGASCYTAAPTVTISGGGGSGAVAVATISSGVVTQITVQNAGSRS